MANGRFYEQVPRWVGVATHEPVAGNRFAVRPRGYRRKRTVKCGSISESFLKDATCLDIEFRIASDTVFGEKIVKMKKYDKVYV